MKWIRTWTCTHMSAVVVGELLLKVHKANNACHKKRRIKQQRIADALR